MLRFVDGWDHYADDTPLTAKWQTAQSALIYADSGRRAGGALVFEVLSDAYVTQFIGAQTVWHLGVAVWFDHIGVANDLVSLLVDGTTVVGRLALLADGTLAYYAGAAGAPLANPGIALAEHLWYHLTLAIDLTANVGSVHVWLDSATIIDLQGTTEDPLQAGAATSATAVRLGSTTATPGDAENGPTTGVRFDDFYVADDGPLGDCRIDTLYPVAAGTYQQWAPIPPDAPTHWGLVDEAIPATTDYVRNDVEGDKETFVVSGLAPLVNAPIFGVQVNALCAKDDAGVAGVKALIKSGATELAAVSGVALQVSWRYVMTRYDEDPNTAIAWTDAGVLAAEYGLMTATVS